MTYTLMIGLFIGIPLAALILYLGMQEKRAKQ